ncbi:uncharacterized protein ARMOST_06230 [Armillaria ostoyae]|uniref:Uncharacterized protein n=1 Tax=Armillaria ostoyae TaxID=47428 RepID=A0A284R2E0_ARMOS|nr:uncharacterized protein ARMOST_06230 [Armillaria ostoyae]
MPLKLTKFAFTNHQKTIIKADCVAYGEASSKAAETGDHFHQDYILASFLKVWFQFYPMAGCTWEECWLAEGEKEQELEQALRATYIEGSTIWPDPDSEDVKEEDMPVSEPDSDAASQELSSVPTWDSTEFQQTVAVWGAHALQALENDGSTVEPAGQTTPVDEQHFVACEAAVEVRLAGWLDWVRRQDDMAHRRWLLTHIDELEAELEAIDASYLIPDPPFEWFGSDRYDESGFLT